jgi:hypothetical protein
VEEINPRWLRYVALGDYEVTEVCPMEFNLKKYFYGSFYGFQIENALVHKKCEIEIGGRSPSTCRSKREFHPNFVRFFKHF